MTPHILENVSTWSVNISNSPPRDPNDDDDDDDDEEKTMRTRTKNRRSSENPTNNAAWCRNRRSSLH
jgi:hypothetical protein